MEEQRKETSGKRAFSLMIGNTYWSSELGHQDVTLPCPAILCHSRTTEIIVTGLRSQGLTDATATKVDIGVVEVFMESSGHKVLVICDSTAHDNMKQHQNVHNN